MKEAEKEAERIIEMFLNVKSNKMNDHSRIEYPTAKQCAIIYVEEKYKDLRELLFSLRVGKVIISERTYLSRLDRLIELEKQVKQAIEKA